MAAENVDKEDVQEGTLLSSIVYEVFSSPLNLLLVCVIAFLVYKIFKTPSIGLVETAVESELPPLKKKDYTLEEVKKYNGKENDGRILIALNGKVYDVTRGKRFYGPGGPYANFAGKDATRGLATFSVDGTVEYDDLSDLDLRDMEAMREWEMQFKEKYPVVGKLLKPGETPTSYSDEEEDTSQDGLQAKHKDD